MSASGSPWLRRYDDLIGVITTTRHPTRRKRGLLVDRAVKCLDMFENIRAALFIHLG